MGDHGDPGRPDSDEGFWIQTMKDDSARLFWSCFEICDGWDSRPVQARISPSGYMVKEPSCETTALLDRSWQCLHGTDVAWQFTSPRAWVMRPEAPGRVRSIVYCFGDLGDRRLQVRGLRVGTKNIVLVLA